MLHLFVREYKRVETSAVYDTDCDFYMKGACFNIYQVATRRVPQVEQELPILPEHLSSSPVRFAVVNLYCSMQCFVSFLLELYCVCFFDLRLLSRGGSRGPHPAPAPPPLKLEKNMIFWRKIMIFHTRYPKCFAPPSAQCNFFKCAPPPPP